MSKAGKVATSSRAGAPRLSGAKAPGSAKRPAPKTVRSQLHLGETTQKRLAVHAALVGRNASRVADEILAGWLARFGQGRRIFDSPEERRDPAGDVDDDRRTDGGQISSDGQEAA